MATEHIPTMPQGSDAERIPTMPQGSDAERIPTMPQGSDAERIPTMPQGSDAEHIPTMPQGSDAEHIPTMPQGSDAEHIPTMPQGAAGADGHIATLPQQTAGTSAAGTPAASGRALLVSGKVTFTGEKGHEFTIDGGTVISNDSGESQIYACSKTGSDGKYIVRILTTVTPRDDIEKRVRRDKVLAFLDKAADRKDSHILPLTDHGTVRLGNAEYYAEVYPFCEGGDLGRRSGSISYETLSEQIIPAINEALREFHQAGFVHRDVKPDNLYEYNGRVVLGDFGITCDLREDGFATDRYKTGTLGYYAPELMSQAAITASDYYSFGQTVWTLYSGEMMYRSILRFYKNQGIEEQRNQINFAMMQNNYIGLDEIPEEHAFLEVLIRGLLQYDPSTRFDYDKVKRWLSGDRSLANEIKGLDSKATFSKPFRLLGGECWDIAELAQKLSENWEDAKKYLYDETLRDFIASEDFDLATYFKNHTKHVMNSASSENRSYFLDAGLSKLLMHLEKDKRLCWCGISIGAIRELDKLKFNNPSQNADGLIRSGLIIEWYLRQKNHSESVLEALRQMHAMYKADPFSRDVATAWTFMFRAVEGHMVYEGMNDLGETAERLLQSPKQFYCTDNPSAVPVIDDWRLLGALCMWGYYEAVQRICQARSQPVAERFEQILTFLEQNTEGGTQETVRKFYHDFGPRAYLNWFRDNLSIYQVKGKKCSELVRQIGECSSDAAAPISEQSKTLSRLETLVSSLAQYREDDIFMAQLGMSQVLPEESLSTAELRGMWGYAFLGQLVPLGFKQFAGL